MRGLTYYTAFVLISYNSYKRITLSDEKTPTQLFNVYLLNLVGVTIVNGIFSWLLDIYAGFQQPWLVSTQVVETIPVQSMSQVQPKLCTEPQRRIIFHPFWSLRNAQ